MMEKLVIGIDFGTDSCRALIVDTVSGKELATHTAYYPRWKEGLYCNPAQNQYRQHPQDYIDSLIAVVQGAIKQLDKKQIAHIVGLGIDTTGSTPCLTNEEGVPLALLPEFQENPNAMFVLWKDHTSVKEADEINALAKKWEVDFTARSGGVYSSEWFWAKALHVLREDESIRKTAYAIIEHSDWMSALLTDNLKPEKVKRNKYATGHKAMWAAEWGGYPSQEFLSTLDPLLDGFAASMDSQTFTSDESAGQISDYWAEKLGLPKHVTIAVGMLDAHAGAVGAGIRAHTMVKIVGTSTCDIIVSPKADVGSKLIAGISGQVDGSVIPGLIGFEAGQSAFGDVYAWLKNILAWSLEPLQDVDTAKAIEDKILIRLTEEAEKLDEIQDNLIANDWLNGRRTPFANQALQGAIAGLTLGTTPSQIFRSLVEATAFGSKTIMDHIVNEEVKITEIIAVGGISQKSPYVMQVLADVMGVNITVASSEQAGALGMAMYAAVAAKVFDKIETAISIMVPQAEIVYQPNKDKSNYYLEKYSQYKKLNKFVESV